MRIAVMGAAGFLGSRVAQALNHAGHQIVCGSLTGVPCDSHSLSLEEVVQSVMDRDLDFILCASGPKPKDPCPFARASELQRLAQAMELAATPGIMLSSMRVMDGHRARWREGAKPRPLTPYASVLSTYESIWSRSSLERRVCRVANLAAMPEPGELGQKALLPWSLVQQAREEGSISVQNPDAVREFISFDDLMGALRFMFSLEGPPIVETYSKPVSVGELAQKISDVTGVPVLGLGNSTNNSIVIMDRDVCRESWLQSLGWASSVTLDNLAILVNDFIHRDPSGFTIQSPKLQP